MTAAKKTAARKTAPARTIARRLTPATPAVATAAATPPLNEMAGSDGAAAEWWNDEGEKPDLFGDDDEEDLGGMPDIDEES